MEKIIGDPSGTVAVPGNLTRRMRLRDDGIRVVGGGGVE